MLCISCIRCGEALGPECTAAVPMHALWNELSQRAALTTVADVARLAEAVVGALSVARVFLPTCKPRLVPSVCAACRQPLQVDLSGVALDQLLAITAARWDIAHDIGDFPAVVAEALLPSASIREEPVVDRATLWALPNGREAK